MISSSALNILSALGFASLGLCQQQYAHLKDQPADSRSPLVQPPQLGLGTWYMDVSVENTTEAVANAIVAGYRHIDGAPIYENEKGVGLGIKEGLKRANLKRSDLWVTTKLWDSNHDSVEKGINDTLKALGLDYIDLYLLHFPIGEKPDPKTSAVTYAYDHAETWQRMEKLIRPNGPTRYIGVANLGPKQLDETLKKATLKPLVHQFEVHPYLQQRDWVKKNKDLNLTVIAYAPLGNTSPTYRTTFYNNKEVWGDIPMLLEHPTIKKIAEKRSCTAVQVALQWNLRRGIVVIPKSSQVAHQKENQGTWYCKVTDEDDKEIEEIEKKQGSRRMLNVCALFGVKTCYDGLTGMERWTSWKSPLAGATGK